MQRPVQSPDSSVRDLIAESDTGRLDLKFELHLQLPSYQRDGLLDLGDGIRLV